MTTYKLWLVAAVVCIIIEILPPPTHFAFLCLALGALGASIAAFFSTAAWLPWIIFVGLSVALLPVLIPLARFLFTPKPHASNADALVGAKALVLEPIDLKAPGTVKVGGEVWRAMTEQETFAKDQWVQVVRVEGTHVLVRRTS